MENENIRTQVWIYRVLVTNAKNDKSIRKLKQKLKLSLVYLYQLSNPDEVIKYLKSKPIIDQQLFYQLNLLWNNNPPTIKIISGGFEKTRSRNRLSKTLKWLLKKCSCINTI